MLEPGPADCRALEKRKEKALGGLDSDAVVSTVTDYGEIASWGVMSNPALVVDDQVVVSGRIRLVNELATLLGAGS